MSFRCQGCNESQPPCCTQTRVVTKIREKTYHDKYADTIGVETVEELALCEPCATKTKDVKQEYTQSRLPDVNALPLLAPLAEVATA